MNRAERLTGEPRKRLNLDLPTRVVEQLDRLMITTGAESRTEVIRRALRVHEIVSNLRTDGRLVLRRADGTEIEILVIP